MPRTLQEMALQGQRKYQVRVHRAGSVGARSEMGGAYRAALPKATTNYAAVFGPKRAAAYADAYATYGAQNYQPQNQWGATWANRWTEAMLQ